MILKPGYSYVGRFTRIIIGLLRKLRRVLIVIQLAWTIFNRDYCTLCMGTITWLMIRRVLSNTVGPPDLDKLCSTLSVLPSRPAQCSRVFFRQRGYPPPILPWWLLFWTPMERRIFQVLAHHSFRCRRIWNQLLVRTRHNYRYRRRKNVGTSIVE